MNKYYQVFKIYVLESLEYRFDVVASGVMSLIYLFALYNLWNTIYKEFAVVGFTLTAMVWYLALGQIIRTGGGRPVRDLSITIQDGTIINYMNKPISFIWHQASTQFGKHFTQLLSSTIICSVFLYFVVGLPDLKLVLLPLVLIVIGLGLLINFLLGFSLATCAFWVEDAKPIHWMYDKFIFILGGFLFPIDLLPPFFINLAKYLPSSYFIYYPAKLFVNFDFNLFIQVVIGQFIFIILFLLLIKFLLYKGTKKLSVNGG